MSNRVAIVGATGLVGEALLRILQQRSFPISELVLLDHLLQRATVGIQTLLEGVAVNFNVGEQGTATSCSPATLAFVAASYVLLRWSQKAKTSLKLVGPITGHFDPPLPVPPRQPPSNE